jgi:hypothetical protein
VYGSTAGSVYSAPWAELGTGGQSPINCRNWRFRKGDLDAYLAKRRVMAR